ncbi:Ankyrin repeat-containing protein [Acorus calamus]|uniref:Ankyrin repeat-containing protein n=1 Tax=Acorus calamus TaxID=4465 RepID=A0AAV9DS88_ACOCL|nr:Ankyrin repeat-containing protein [Acorus calamus]
MDTCLMISTQDFFAAVRSGDMDSLKGFIEGRPPEGVTALMSLKNDVGETALYLAAEKNLEEIFRYLLEFCDLETASIRPTHGLTAFHIAAKNGHLEIVKEFLSRWPSLCKICDSSNTSPLYSAAVKDKLDVVNAILDVDETAARIVRKNGKTSLHTAARYGNLHIVNALLVRDREIVSIIDKKGQTALHMAVKGQNTEIVEEILLADISILNSRDKKGNTALHMATRKWRSEEKVRMGGKIKMVELLLSYESIEVNAVNNQHETALDLAEKIPYGRSSLVTLDALREAGAKYAKNIGESNEAMELRRTVSDIKHEVHTQLLQNANTNQKVRGIAKDLRKLHREAVQNTINSVTVVAVLIASIAFMSIFNLPGQYIQSGDDVGKANIADFLGFKVFCILNAIALFISLAVVVVQITLVAWETGAQKQIVSVVNKLMWIACLSTCGAFLSLAFLVVGTQGLWMAITITVIGGSMLVVTLLIMCYLVLKQRFCGFNDDSQRRIRRGGGSKSFSSIYSGISDVDAYTSGRGTSIYAL